MSKGNVWKNHLREFPNRMSKEIFWATCQQRNIQEDRTVWGNVRIPTWDYIITRLYRQTYTATYSPRAVTLLAQLQTWPILSPLLIPWLLSLQAPFVVVLPKYTVTQEPKRYGPLLTSCIPFALWCTVHDSYSGLAWQLAEFQNWDTILVSTAHAYLFILSGNHEHVTCYM